MAIDKKKFAKQLGSTIAQYRLQSKLTQEQLAELVGIGNEAVSRIERGVVMPTLVRLIEFADIFQCNVADLLTKNSPRAQDEAEYLTQILSEIKEDERKLAVEMVEKLAAHFKVK